MQRDIPHGKHFMLIQMVGQDSSRWPLKIVEQNYREYPGGFYWATEYFSGSYRVIAVALTYSGAEEFKRRLMPNRYKPNIDGYRYSPYRIINPEETEELLDQLEIASHPDCLYTYQKGEVYYQWLNRQRP